jgi:beta-N-acetylhexosaminidase
MKCRLIMWCIVTCLCAVMGSGCNGLSDGGTSAAQTPTTTLLPAATEAAAEAASTTTLVLSTTTTTLSPAEQLLAGMTLRQKAAQVLLLAIDGTTLSASTQQLLAGGPPGGILLLGQNITGSAQTQALTEDLQNAAVAAGSKIGLFIAVDQEGGLVQRVDEGVPEVPRARKLGETSTPEEAALLAAETAQGLLAQGVNMNLAPVADVVDDADSFLYPRTYGGDAGQVSEFVAAVTRAYEQSGLIAVVKHFPGHGSASGNTHGDRVVSDATEAEFETIHLPPFQAAIEAGAEGVMMAHIVATAYDPEEPASRSDPIIEGLLREDLGFTGLVVSDDLEMAAATASAATTSTAAASGARPEGQQQPTALGSAAVAALRAGCDLLICTGVLARNLEVLDAIVAAVESDEELSARLDEAVLRILEVKLRHKITPSAVAPRP